MFKIYQTTDPEAVLLSEAERIVARDAVPWERFEPSRYAQPTIELARVAWTRRLLGEYQSMVTMSALAARLAATNEPVAMTASALRMAQDELRHAELCGRMADLLGGRAAVTMTSHHPKADLDDEVMTMLCIDESLSLSFLESGRGAIRDPVLAAIGDALLRDEVFHARCGWAWLNLRGEAMTDADRQRLSASAAQTLNLLAPLEACDEQGAVGKDALALGFLSPRGQRAAFRRAVDQWILPGLAALGIRPQGSVGTQNTSS